MNPRDLINVDYRHGRTTSKNKRDRDKIKRRVGGDGGGGKEGTSHGRLLTHGTHTLR